MTTNHHPEYLSAVLNSSIGNIIEWYDFGLFTLFSSLFSQLFFPSYDPRTALALTFGIAAVGFLCRPIGAVIFGYAGDKIGRARTLRSSIFLISLSTVCIGFLPTYEQIGISAPLLLIIIRMLQGICIGGECTGNFIYIAESAPDRYRATCVSFVSVGANAGLLLAALVGMFLSHWFSYEFMHVWGWRLPYLVSGILCLLIYKFRLRLPETSVFTYLKNTNQLNKNPTLTVLKTNLPQLLHTLGLTFMGSTFYYFCFSFLPVYLSKHPSTAIQYSSSLIALLVGLMLFIVPIAGLCCDYFGRRKLLLFNSFMVACGVIPGFYLLHDKQYIPLYMILLFFTLISSFEQGTTPIAMVENFPPQTRYTGVSIGYNLGNGILGGTLPFVCQWLLLNTHFSLAPAIYVAACASVTFLVVYFYIPETKGIDLKECQTPSEALPLGELV